MDPPVASPPVCRRLLTTVGIPSGPVSVQLVISVLQFGLGQAQTPCDVVQHTARHENAGCLGGFMVQVTTVVVEASVVKNKKHLIGAIFKRACEINKAKYRKIYIVFTCTLVHEDDYISFIS